MDFFDDIYEYLSLLLKIEYYDDFFLVLDVVERLTKVTAIKNLERKLLSLKIKYYRENNIKIGKAFVAKYKEIKNDKNYQNLSEEKKMQLTGQIIRNTHIYI